MPSAQVTLVIETEKEAARIEQDARAKAQEILAAAKEKADANRTEIKKTADADIGSIHAATQAQLEEILVQEQHAAADMISVLQATAEKHKDKAIQAAVSVLTGRT